MSNANNHQVGGNHYKKFQIEVWDFIAKNDIPYLEGNAIKYIARWKDKGGVDDLKKAKHYIDKLIELEECKLLGEQVHTCLSDVQVNTLTPATGILYTEKQEAIHRLGRSIFHGIVDPEEDAYVLDPTVRGV